MKIRLLRLGEKVLTVTDRPIEDDAFKYYIKYLPKETVLNKPPISPSSKKGYQHDENIH